MKRVDWVPLFVLAIGAGLFGATRANAVQVADSAELVAVACTGGVAHPPGYPLYTLLGHAFCSIPLATPAARLSLLSIFAGLWALWSIYALLRRLTQKRWTSALGALVAATGWLFWRYCSLPEVFALNAALCLAATHAGLVALEATTTRRRHGAVLAMGLFFGLALSNHHSAALLGALPLWVVVAPLRPYRRVVFRAALALLGLTLGLLPYLHLLFADPHTLPFWGDTTNLRGLIHHVLRRDYGTFRLSLNRAWSGWATLGAFAQALPAQLGWVFLPVGALGFGVASWGYQWPRDKGFAPTHHTRWYLRLLAVSWLVCGPAFFLLFNIRPEGIGLQVVERFFVLPSAIAAVFVGLGTQWLDQKWLQQTRKRRGRFYQVLGFVLLLPVALHNYPRADVHDNYAVEDYARNVLRTVAPHALVLGVGDLRVFSLAYAQHVLGLRPDVQYVSAYLLLHRWYVEQHHRRFPRFNYRYQPGTVDTVGLIRDHLQRGIPVYLAEVYNEKVARSFASYPIGPLRRLVSSPSQLPNVTELAGVNRRLEQKLLRRGRDPDPSIDPWAASLREPTAATWYAIGRGAAHEGHRDLAADAVAHAQRWAPWLALPGWAGTMAK